MRRMQAVHRVRSLGLALGSAALVAGAFTLAPTTSPGATDSAAAGLRGLHDGHDHHARAVLDQPEPTAPGPSWRRRPSRTWRPPRPPAGRAACRRWAASRIRSAEGWACTTSTTPCSTTPSTSPSPRHWSTSWTPTAPSTGLVAHEYIVPIDAWTRKAAAASVRSRVPPAPDAAALRAARVAVEGQRPRSLRRLEPSRPPVPAGCTHLRQGPPRPARLTGAAQVRITDGIARPLASSTPPCRRTGRPVRRRHAHPGFEGRSSSGRRSARRRTP